MTRMLQWNVLYEILPVPLRISAANIRYASFERYSVLCQFETTADEHLDTLV